MWHVRLPGRVVLLQEPRLLVDVVRVRRALAPGPDLVLYRRPLPAPAAVRGRGPLCPLLPRRRGIGGREARGHGPGRPRGDSRGPRRWRRGRARDRHAVLGGGLRLPRLEVAAGRWGPYGRKGLIHGRRQAGGGPGR